MAKNSEVFVIPDSMRFGNLAIHHGLITKEEFQICLKIQKAGTAKGRKKDIGRIAIENGFMTAEQVKAVLMAQTRLVQDDRKMTRDIEIKGYKIVTKIGDGGMGVVYKAVQESMNRQVALKVLHKKWIQDEEFRMRFLLEAQLVGKLSHENLIQVYDVGRDGNRLYFAMEFVDGESVEQIIERDGAMSPHEVARIAIQILDVIDYIAEHDMVHRDIKPGNIMLTSEGRIKLGDFGFVKSSQDKEITQEGMVVGTPDYIAPEQARGLDVDYRADIYSLGISMYHMLTGDPPFTGTNSEIMRKHISSAVPSPEQLKLDIRDDIWKIIKRMIEKDVERRAADIGELIEELELVQVSAGDGKETDMPQDVGKTTFMRVINTEKARIEKLEEINEGLKQQIGEIKFYLWIALGAAGLFLVLMFVLLVILWR